MDSSLELITKHQKLLVRYAELMKGKYKRTDSTYRWFYGHFVYGQPITSVSLEVARREVANATYWLSHQDAYNQVVSFLLQMSHTFNKKKKRGSNFKQYIRYALGFQIIDWIDIYCKQERAFMPNTLDEITYMEEVQPFTLNLPWIIYGNGSPLFRNTKPYDRYLLYLYFVENNNIRQIAKATFQSKNTVASDLQKALSKCRETIS